MAKKNYQSTYANIIGSCTVNVDPNDNWADYMRPGVDTGKNETYAEGQNTVQQTPYTYMDAAPVVTVRPRHNSERESAQQIMNIRQRNIMEQQKRYNEAWKQRIAMMLDDDEEPVVNTDTVSVVKDQLVNVATVNDMPKPVFRENVTPVETLTEEKMYDISDNTDIPEKLSATDTESVIEEPAEDSVEESTDEYDNSNIIEENISVADEIINEDFDNTFGSVNNDVSFDDEPKFDSVVENTEMNDAVVFSEEYDNVNITPKKKRGRPLDSGAIIPISDIKKTIKNKTAAKKTAAKKSATKKSATKKTKK